MPGCVGKRGSRRLLYWVVSCLPWALRLTNCHKQYRSSFRNITIDIPPWHCLFETSRSSYSSDAVLYIICWGQPLDLSKLSLPPARFYNAAEDKMKHATLACGAQVTSKYYKIYKFPSGCWIAIVKPEPHHHVICSSFRFSSAITRCSKAVAVELKTRSQATFSLWRDFVLV